MADTSIDPPHGEADSADNVTILEKENSPAANELSPSLSQRKSLPFSLASPSNSLAAESAIPSKSRLTLYDIADQSERRDVFNAVNFTGTVDNNGINESGDNLNSHDNNKDGNSNNPSNNIMSSQTASADNGPAGRVSASYIGPVDTNISSDTSDPSQLLLPPSSPSRHDSRSMGRTVDRPVEEKPLLDEIREVLAQSNMMFLVADLRHLSATGRIGIKYENLRLDSDNCKRDTAESIACLSDNVNDDTFQQIGHHRGLSPAVIMAMLILEIRDTAVRTAEEKKKAGKGKKNSFMSNVTTASDIDNDDNFVGYTGNTDKKRLFEETMGSLMKVYSRMISEDLVAEIPHIRRRKAKLPEPNHDTLRGSALPTPQGLTTPKRNIFFRRGVPDDIDSSMRSNVLEPVKEVKEDSIRSVGFEVEPLISNSVDSDVSKTDGKDTATSDTTNEDAKPKSASKIRGANVSFAIDGDTQSQESQRRPSALNLFSPVKWTRGLDNVDGQNPRSHVSFRDHVNKAAENSKQIADQFKSNMQLQVENLMPTDHEAQTKQEFQELTDIFFNQGEVNEDIKNSLGASYTRTEMVDIMRNAVEARNDNRLQFLSSMFRSGTISRLMVESHARFVWMNDWYIMKDLIYAISVDPLQRRVMVIFRGCDTITDWKTTLEMGFHTVKNPVMDDYDGRNEKLRVYSGVYRYLFRKRKDTGTTKYGEIANMVHKYGMDRIGSDYKVFVTGHSLGGALTHFFAFWASSDDRFTKNGPVKAIAFASPCIGGHSWADAFRHQERMNKLQLVQCRNNEDFIPRMPFNFAFGKRGPLWRHVGIGVTMPRVPRCGRKFKPLVHYWGKEKSWWESMLHGYRRNLIFHLPYLRPWMMDRSHKLAEMQDRLIYGESHSDDCEGFTLLQTTLDQLYEKLKEHNFETLKKAKRWNIHLPKGKSRQLREENEIETETETK